MNNSVKNIYFILALLNPWVSQLGAMALFDNSYFLEHKNIRFQKNYETHWTSIWKQKLPEKPDLLAKKFKKALNKNIYHKNNQNNSPFFLGLSSSAYQFEGGIGEESSWHRFALKKGDALPGKACNFWKNYKTMIAQMKEECNINSFRLSISWERLQKTAYTLDDKALNHYKKIIKELKKHGIEPLVVFHHYTVPTWFEDMGGFEKEENTAFFVNFALKVYEELADEVTFWSTFNAIEGYAFKGYYTLDGAPGKTKSMHLTAQVMCNMLKAHTKIYKAIKGLPHATTQNTTSGRWHELVQLYPEKHFPCPQIGIQKNIIFLDIAYDKLIHYLMAPTTWALCSMGNLLQNDGFYNFFNTGTYSIYIPGMVNVTYTDEDAPFTLDWIGLNTYANQKRFLMATVQDTDNTLTTCNPNYRYYPQGLYRAVHEIHRRINKKIGITDKKGNVIGKPTQKMIPIWITENGIAAHTDAQRTDFFKKTLFIVTKLLEEQLPLIGYTPWAAFDNYEWGSKTLGEKRYGMFYVDFTNVEKKPILKEGSVFFSQFTKECLAS